MKPDLFGRFQRFSLQIAILLAIFSFGVLSVGAPLAEAQDQLPRDNGLATYHTAPHYRESESHPLRIVSYVLHPIGWLAREVLFRPFSYFASSSETRRSVLGYRDPFDYRRPECFSSDQSAPDCRSIIPFNYDAGSPEATEEIVDDGSQVVRQVYFPDVNFDFDKGSLNDLGKGRAYQIAELLGREPSLRVVLEGHTDFIGTEDYNEKLGMRRAEAVRSELLALGVSPERLSSVTFGKSQPALSQETDWARAVNRRVEVHLDNAAPAAGDVAEMPAEGSMEE
ncbi:MAG: OmpA family protein [Bdellovibrionales bacterium]|nr:OmpA family protein [Bdellovibrionales bacterium]